MPFLQQFSGLGAGLNRKIYSNDKLNEIETVQKIKKERRLICIFVIKFYYAVRGGMGCKRSFLIKSKNRYGYENKVKKCCMGLVCCSISDHGNRSSGTDSHGHRAGHVRELRVPVRRGHCVYSTV